MKYTEKEDDSLEEVKKCLEEAKEFTKTINEKKAHFVVEKLNEQIKGEILESIDFFNIGSNKKFVAQEHSFEESYLTNEENCIVCKNLILNNPKMKSMKCKKCKFWCHKQCSSLQSKIIFLFFFFIFFFFLFFFFLNINSNNFFFFLNFKFLYYFLFHFLNFILYIFYFLELTIFILLNIFI